MPFRPKDAPKTTTRRTGWVTSELYYWHDTQNWSGFFEPSLTVQPGEHFENPETKRRMNGLVEATGLAPCLHPIRPEPVEEAFLTKVHPQSYLDHLKAVCASGGGDAGQLTPVGPASYEIAQLAVGGVLKAVDAVFTGAVDNAYVLCRPPGHHAMPELAMGFCLLANAALGIKYAQETYGIERIATVDWDVHHGNGTQAIFYDDPSVLTISLHQNNLFPPNSGFIEETGEGAGQGVNLNIPLPPGSGSGAYREAFKEIVLPALEAFKPQAIFVPSGYDASALDPLGIMMLSSEDYRWMIRQVLEVADRHCEGRLIVTHEGGYSATYVPYCGLAVVEEMSGVSDTLEDPFHVHIAGYGGHDLSGDQAKAIQAAKAAYFGE
ncbi:class II histone deacetylase [Pseudodonghicola sp.]|uniref:class II histone deacetylase n=1 Tax=Pseudodonghicola sp. TaxID=1969463 RepID=UPI003A9772CB